MLKIEKLSLSIGGTKILDGVDLAVKEGETVGIIGPNGSGKTTLFNSICGFHRPQSGNIFFKEEDVTRLPPYRRAQRGLGRVFQNSAVFKEMTVLENMVVALEGRQPLRRTFFPWSEQNKQNRARALEYLDETGLKTRSGDKAASLSGGQMRLLEITRVLAFGADLFLLDEPTAGVSPRMKEDVAHLLLRLKSLKKTLLVIEHDINFIQRFCDRIVVLDVGKVVLDDTPSRIRSNPMLQEIYFGSDENGGTAHGG